MIFLRKNAYLCIMSLDRKKRLKIRNDKIRKDYHLLEKRHPKWRFDAIIEDLADKYFLSARTIEAIIKEEYIYSEM